MATSKNVDSWISEHDPALRQICHALRNLILLTDPGLSESIKWSNPVYEKNGKIMHLAATERYVALGFFDGTGLADPQGRLEGTGRKMRHIKVRALEDVDNDQFTSWIRQAIALDVSRSR